MEHAMIIMVRFMEISLEKIVHIHNMQFGVMGQYGITDYLFIL